MLPFILVAALNTTDLQPTIDFRDSTDDKNITYIIVNDTCKVKILKSALKDYDKVVDVVMKKCGL